MTELPARLSKHPYVLHEIILLQEPDCKDIIVLYKAFHDNKKRKKTKTIHIACKAGTFSSGIFESKTAKAEEISGAVLPYACIVLMHLPRHLPLTTAGYRTHISVHLCSNLQWLFLCSHVSSVGFFIIFLKK